jgi:hypothetical protein
MKTVQLISIRIRCYKPVILNKNVGSFGKLVVKATGEAPDPALDSTGAAEAFRSFEVAEVFFFGFYGEKPTKAPSPGSLRKSGKEHNIRNLKNSANDIIK